MWATGGSPSIVDRPVALVSPSFSILISYLLQGRRRQKARYDPGRATSSMATLANMIMMPYKKPRLNLMVDVSEKIDGSQAAARPISTLKTDLADPPGRRDSGAGRDGGASMSTRCCLRLEKMFSPWTKSYCTMPSQAAVPSSLSKNAGGRMVPTLTMRPCGSVASPLLILTEVRPSPLAYRLSPMGMWMSEVPSLLHVKVLMSAILTYESGRLLPSVSSK
mmetsp:Transcript_9572/g.22548  ORF Transcript_9572/g.22548 Transcript_9572/m.22548 type:complete len:221 (-) Transcript_9572:1952-2614(-)